MENISLYQMTEAFQTLENMEDEEMAPYLESLEVQIENKVDAIVKYRQNLTLGASAIDQEIQRLTKMKQAAEKRAESLKSYISSAMLTHNIEKIDTGLFKLSFLKSESVEIINEQEIPAEFIKVKTTTSVDKVEIKKLLKKGIEVNGASLRKSNNLQIK
jgi:hypothetical protein